MLSRIPDAGPDALGGLPEIHISRRLPAKQGAVWRLHLLHVETVEMLRGTWKILERAPFPLSS